MTHSVDTLNIGFNDEDILGSLPQDDPRLIQIIRNWFLEPPPGTNVPLYNCCSFLFELSIVQQTIWSFFIHQITVEKVCFIVIFN